jgi:gliding motility-associated-like protein
VFATINKPKNNFMRKIYVFTLLLFMGLSFDAFAQNIKYVKVGGAGDGSTWANASGDLQAMIDASTGEDSIWVAKGIYKPERLPVNKTTKLPIEKTASGVATTSRDFAFVIRKDVKIFGGFLGDELSFEDRNIALNETILTGDLNGDDITDTADVDYKARKVDNAYHIIVNNNDNGQAVIDGVILEGGYADGIGSVAVDLEISQSTGGAIGSRGANLEYTLRNVTFRNNYAKGNGGAAWIRMGGTKEFIFENVKFLNNHSGGQGGGFYFYPSTSGSISSFINCVFDGNSSVGSGGGMYMNVQSSTRGLTLKDVHFLNNRAQGSSGGFYNNGSSLNNVIIEGGSFKNNIGTASGSGLYLTGTAAANAVISDVDFDTNQNLNPSNSHYGGHIYSTMKVSITNSTFKNGRSGIGGALYGSASAVYNVTNSRFENNVSTNNSIALNSIGGGGAVYFGANASNPSYIENCVFIGNSTQNYGGAIQLNGNKAPIVNCSFYNNTAAFSGGAISVIGTSSIITDITNSLFYNNTATSNSSSHGGGAISLRDDRLSARVINSTFYGNSSAANGGVLYTANAGATPKNEFYNSILWANTANAGAEFLTGNAANVVVKSTLTQAYGTDGVDDNIVGADPNFVNTTDITDPNFLRLSNSSRAINMGDELLLTTPLATDLQGKDRIIHDFLDLGAYEYDGPLDNLVALHVMENAPVGTEVGQLTTTTLTGTLTWEILSGNINDTFSYDAATGMIAIAKNELLDYETRRAFRLRVRASNGIQSDDFPVFILVDNMMEKPGTPVIVNYDSERREVRSQYPILSGVAESNSTVIIYMNGKQTDATTTTDDRGNWKFTFTQPVDLDKIHSFHIVTSSATLGTSVDSDPVSSLFVLYPGEIKPTTLLTLNNDQINDIWVVHYLPQMYPKNEVIVFNKAGKVVFKKSNYQNDWNGTDMTTNQLLNSGVYYYKILVGGGFKTYTGSITVLKGR